jgi:Zn-dependent M28 family amino/carboxypeptidase
MKMKALSLFFIGFGLTSCAMAQVDPLAQKYAGEITVQSATKHLTILASDEFEGRDTGKPGGEKAAKYLEEEFRKLGLIAPVNGSYRQAVELVESKFEVSGFSLNGKDRKMGDGYFMTGAGGQTTVESSDIVFIGYGISSDKYDDLKGIDISGKVVLLINESEPLNSKGVSYISGTSELSEWATQRNKRIQAIQAKNPKLILAVSSEVPNMLQRFGNSFSRARIMLAEDLKKASASVPVAHISPEIADELLKKSKTSVADLKAKIGKSGKPASKAYPATVKASYGTNVKPVKADNVLGYLEGTDLKEEVVVISAHYDHVGVEGGEIFNGADDDGSGTTGVLEMAKAFAKAKADGHSPRRSILFLAVTAEEKGLLGSDYYSRHPIFPLANTVTNLNIDMIGRIDPPHEANPNYIYLIGSDKLSSELHAISEKANETYVKLNLDYKYNDPNDPERIYYRSDHYNFAKHGIPVIFYFNGVHADYHKATDTVEKINFDMLVKRTKLVFHTAWDVANRDKRPVVDSNKK